MQAEPVHQECLTLIEDSVSTQRPLMGRRRCVTTLKPAVSHRSTVSILRQTRHAGLTCRAGLSI